MATDSNVCPFLVPVVADRLWMYPVTAYCRRSERIHVPGAATLATRCTDPSHTSCRGYLATVSGERTLPTR